MPERQERGIDTRARRSARFIRVLAVVIVLGLAAVIAARVFEDAMVAWQMPFTGTELSIAIIYLLIVVTWLGLVCWVIRYGRRPWPVRLLQGLGLGLLLAAPLIIWEPVFGGSLWPRGWRPRFWSTARPFENPARNADLGTTTPNDFPGFLGPNRDGNISQVRLDPNWTANPPKLLWRRPIGEGWSGIAAVNGYAVTMQQIGPQECITCFAIETGDVVWNFGYARRHQETLGGVGPRSTPQVHAGRVYALGSLGDLYCLDGSNGTPVWSVQLLDLGGIPLLEKTNARGEKFQVEKSNLMWGRAASPLLYGDNVVVPLGGDAALIALDRNSGQERWRGGDQFIGYGSPSVAQIGGEDQILIVNENSVSGHDPKYGPELWRSMRPGRSNGDANTSQATGVGQNRVLVSKGYGAGGELLAIERGEDGRWKARSLWANARVLRTKLTNPIVDDQGNVFALSDGILECVDLETGERIWRANKRYGHGQLLRVGDLLLVHSEDGVLALVAGDRSGFREWATIETISGVCWNTLCLYGDRLIVRSDQEMACFRLPLLPSAADERPSN